jgi:hypothetical protein
MNAFIIELENRPGSLAETTAAIAEKGINITGVAGAASGAAGALAIVTNDESATRSALQGIDCRFREIGLASASLEDKPGSLAAAARALADAGVNIEAVFPTGMEGGKITVAFGVDNVEAARSALGQLTGATARG